MESGITAKVNILIREATLADNDGLVKLTSLSTMKGDISIRIDRKPDFFKLLELRGPSFVIIAELDNKIIGSCSATAVNVFIQRKQEIIYYIADFRVHPDFRGTTLAIRISKAMFRKLDILNADILFSTAAFGNKDVIPFSKSRALLPKVDEIGTFNVLQIFPTPFKSRKSKYLLEEVQLKPSIIGFFNEFMKKFQLGQIYSEKSFENTTLITASFNNKMVAAITLFDPGFAKQNVLIKLPFGLNFILKSIRLIYPIIRFPKINEEVRLLYIKSLAYEPSYEDALRCLIAKARYFAYKRKYTFLSLGIHEKDPMLKVFSGYPKFNFKSLGFVLSRKGSQHKINSILNGIPFEDYSLV